MYEKPPRPMSRAGKVVVSRHSFLNFSGTLFCTKCQGRAPNNVNARNLFLASECRPDKKLHKAMTVGNTRPTRMPADLQVKVGRSMIHKDHSVCLFKGLYFCSLCGYNASVKAQKLREPCTDRSETARRRVVRLLSGKLPSGVAAWPNEASTKPGAMLQLG